MSGAHTEILVVRAPREVAGGALPDLAVAAAPHVLGGGPGLVLDLSTTVFVSSAGLSEMIRLGMDLRDRGALLTLAAPTRPVEKILRTIGMEQVMPIFRTVAEAWSHILAHGERRR